MRVKARQPMTPIDYAVMIGGPVAFMLVAIFGLLWVLGPAPPPNPIELIKNKTIRVGMFADKVRHVLGDPKSKIATADGGSIWSYHHGTADPFVEDDADLTFSQGGYLMSIATSRSAAPVQATQEKANK